MDYYRTICGLAQLFFKRGTCGNISNYRGGELFIEEGQRWELTEDISNDLRRGVYILEEYMGDRMFFPREDKQRFLAPGEIAIYDCSWLTDKRFKLLEKEKKNG